MAWAPEIRARRRFLRHGADPVSRGRWRSNVRSTSISAPLTTASSARSGGRGGAICSGSPAPRPGTTTSTTRGCRRARHHDAHIYTNLFDAVLVRRSLFWALSFEFLGFAAGAKLHCRRLRSGWEYCAAWLRGNVAVHPRSPPAEAPGRHRAERRRARAGTVSVGPHAGHDAATRRPPSCASPPRVRAATTSSGSWLCSKSSGPPCLPTTGRTSTQYRAPAQGDQSPAAPAGGHGGHRASRAESHHACPARARNPLRRLVRRRRRTVSGRGQARTEIPAWMYELGLYRLSAGFIGWTPYLAGRALTMGAPRAMTAANFATCSGVLESRADDPERLGIPESALVFGLVGSLIWDSRQCTAMGWNWSRPLGAAPAAMFRCWSLAAVTGLTG